MFTLSEIIFVTIIISMIAAGVKMFVKNKASPIRTVKW